MASLVGALVKKHLFSFGFPSSTPKQQGSNQRLSLRLAGGRRIGFATLLVIALALAPSLRAQDESSSAASSASTEDGAEAAVAVERPTYRIVALSGDVVIDGVMDESAWDDATSIDLAYETRPGENIPAPVQTDCRIAYDTRQLYFGCRAYDPEPSAIRANLSDRDTAFSDDFVGIIIDTFNDERRGFEFFVNPLGVQMDLTLSDVGNHGGEDSAWNTIWDSAGKITDEGYVVEMAIPFSSLRFQRADGEQTWGFYAFRAYPRSVRHQISDVPFSRNINCTLCQVGKVVGLDGATPGRNLEIVPTVTGSRTDSASTLGGPIESGSEDGEAGLTATWGVTPNLTLSGTVNPDFSQVEADVAQLDVNNQFALFFPERRPFFLEGADFFSTPINAVFTRNVADPDFGVKLTGKVEKNAFGVFAAQDTRTNLLFPGSQGSSATSLDMDTTDTVLRYRRDVGDASTLGVIFTDRQGGDYMNRVGGVDGLFRLSDKQSLRVQALGSQTAYPGSIVDDFDQPAGTFEDTAWRINYNYDDRDWFVYSQVSDFGADFRADMGFVPQVDRKFYLAGGQKVWWGEDGDWFNRIGFGGDYDVTEDQNGQKLEEEAELQFNYDGPLQSFVFFGIGTRDQFFDGVTFEQVFENMFLTFRPTGDLQLSLDAGYGDAIDFSETREGTQLRLGPRIEWNAGRRTKLRLQHNYRHLDVEGGRLFEANLSQLRAVYQINIRTFIRAIGQYTTIERDPTLHQDAVDAKTEQLFAQLLFSYKINPQTVLFLGYSESRLGDDSVDLSVNDRSFFLKIGYAWVL